MKTLPLLDVLELGSTVSDFFSLCPWTDCNKRDRELELERTKED